MLNPTYTEMAAHHGTVVIAARPGKPRHKAKVEGGVLIAASSGSCNEALLAIVGHTCQHWIVAYELNEAIAELLERFDTRAFVKLSGFAALCSRSVD